MSPPSPTTYQPQPAAPIQRLEKLLGWLAHALAVGAFVCVLIRLLGNSRMPAPHRWPDALLILTATLTTLVSLRQQLPWQNVLQTAAIIGFIGSAAHAIGAETGMPFGPFVFTHAGPPILGTVPWSVPFLWIVIVLNSRGVVRLILRPWRKFRSYGFWLIGLTAGLVVLFDFALEPYATKINQYWLWRETKLGISWYGMPVINPIGWAVTSLLILAFATPSLINKQPRPRQSPPDYHPLIVWLLALVLFAVGAGTQKFWPVTIVCIATSILVSAFAIRGARW